MIFFFKFYFDPPKIVFILVNCAAECGVSPGSALFAFKDKKHHR